MSRTLTESPPRDGGFGQLSDSWHQPAWEALLGAIEDPDPFVSLRWQHTWWRHFASGQLAVIRAPAAVAALELARDGTAQFLGGQETTDYPGPVMATGAGASTAAALLAALPAHGARLLDARNQRPEVGLAGALVAAARALGRATEVTDDEAGAILELPSTAQEYGDRLARRTRHELARKRRRLQRAYPHATVRTATAATLSADLTAFCALHRAARGAKGHFMTAALEAFMRDLARATLDAGMLRLDTLQAADGQPLAMTLGFQGPRTFYLYNAAYELGAAAVSPGIVLIALLIERAIAERLASFDFLRGLERYKLELGASPRTLSRVRVALG